MKKACFQFHKYFNKQYCVYTSFAISIEWLLNIFEFFPCSQHTCTLTQTYVIFMLTIYLLEGRSECFLSPVILQVASGYSSFYVQFCRDFMDLPKYHNFYFEITFFSKQTQSRSDLIILCFSSLPPYVSVVRAVIHKLSGSRSGFAVVLEYRFYNMQFPSSEVNGLFSGIRFLRHRSYLQRHIGTQILFKDIPLIWARYMPYLLQRRGGIPQTTARPRLNKYPGTPQTISWLHIP